MIWLLVAVSCAAIAALAAPTVNAGSQGVARLAATAINQLRSHMGRRWLRVAGEAAGAGAFAATAWLIRVRHVIA